LDYNGLKKRIKRAASGVAAKPLAIAAAPFLELRPAGRHASVDCTIECEDGNGTTLRIHLQGQDLPDLAALEGGPGENP
jgi:hypothetical protein